MRKITIAILALILIGMLIPIGFSTDSNVVITYGETTYSNPSYKASVDSFFADQSKLDIGTIGSKVITADQVNKVSSSITGKTYTSSQIFSSALVNLNDNSELKVTVDKSKITVVTGDMYISALKSAGITSGHVYVTSPVSASGESALAGIMNAYEEVTDVEIPDSVKQAVNDEIYTEAEIVNKSDVNADDLSKLVDEVKQDVSKDNITDHTTIVNIINNYVQTNNINITNNDIENLADSIEQVQNVQGDVEYYQSQVSDFVNNTTSSDFSLDGILDWIKSFVDGI